ncbi:MAG: hypothetical protein KKG14_03505 [Alphaproteobacteria bacterium]|nr:hypothetical protein [Alphaproteobacteria bacterium]MBU2417747.1 hypothetical protein [Alphaproteobacteria bacterium]
MRGSFSLLAIFGAPLALAVLSLIGLIGALLADGLWDGLGAALLGASLAAIVWARFRRRPTGVRR